MTLRDDLLPVCEALRAIPDTLGVREYTVTIRMETHASAIADDTTPTVNTDTVISPTPYVEQLSTEQAALYGGGPMSGNPQNRVYEISGITPEFSAGGYALSDLSPTIDSPSKRVVVILDGPDCDNEPFSIVRIDRTRFHISLVVKRTASL